MLSVGIEPKVSVAAPASGRKAQSSAASVVALLYVAYLISFADRVIFGMSLKPIKASLGLTDSQLGLLSGAAFAISYAVFSPFGGIMVDRFRRTAVMAMAIAFFSLMTLLTGLASGFGMMALARVGVGVGESFIAPLAVSLISDVVVRERRARMFALYLSAGAVGSILALLLGGLVVHSMTGSSGLDLPVLGHLQPWQGLFAAAAVPGVLLAIVVLLVLREPIRIVTSTQKDAHGFEKVWPFVRNYWPLIVSMFVGLSTFQIAGYTFSTWSVVFFERVHGWSSVRTALTLGSTVGISTLIGCLMCGRLIEYLRNRGYVDAPLRVGVIAGLTFAVFGSAATLTSSSTLAVIFFMVAGFTGYWPAVTIYAMMGDIVPSTARGRFSAVHVLAIGIIANALGPLVVGMLNDTLFPSPSGIRYSLAATFLISAVAGTLIVYPGLKLYRRRMTESVAD